METWQQGQQQPNSSLSPTPFEKRSGPWSLYSAASKGGTEPFLLFNSSRVALPLQQVGSLKLGGVLRRGGNPRPLSPPFPCTRVQYFDSVRSRDLAGAGGARNGNKSLLTWAKPNSMNFPFWQLEGGG